LPEFGETLADRQDAELLLTLELAQPITTRA
jgi:hypothetical protein